MSHSDETVKQVIENWHAGLSGSECARACNLATRNTAIGIISRHRATGCEVCNTRVGSNGGGPRPRDGMPGMIAPRRHKAAALPPPVVLPPIGPVGDLPPNGCHYIEGEFSRDFQMCGRPQEVGPWCEAHAAKVYVKTPSPQRPPVGYGRG